MALRSRQLQTFATLKQLGKLYRCAQGYNQGLYPHVWYIIFHDFLSQFQWWRSCSWYEPPQPHPTHRLPTIACKVRVMTGNVDYDHAHMIWMPDIHYPTIALSPPATKPQSQANRGQWREGAGWSTAKAVWFWSNKSNSPIRLRLCACISSRITAFTCTYRHA